LENAGRAPFVIGKLTECSKIGKWEDLRPLIPKTLFGTCMTDVEGSVFEELSELNAQRPAKVGQFIDALETLGGTAGSGKSFFDGLYAFLCDLAHASQRANRSYCQSLESGEEGWILQYTWEEAMAKPESVGGALRSTLRSLQCGYAACAMLLAWRFADSPDGLKWNPSLKVTPNGFGVTSSTHPWRASRLPSRSQQNVAFRSGSLGMTYASSACGSTLK
jgi:hypothetical protein